MSDDVPNRLKTLIVDDEPLAVERLQLLCARQPQLDLVGTAGDGEAALRLAEQLSPDLILLDINMPRLDGIATARALAKFSQTPAIIFVTAYDRFAVEAFDIAAVDYVLKPVAPDRLERAVERVIARQALGQAAASQAETSDCAQEFWVPYRSELLRIEAAQIDRVEAERDYMRLHVGERSYLLHETIKTLEERLDPAQFIRIHRSHIIRQDFIAGLKHGGAGVWHAHLTDGAEIRIGRTYLPSVKKIAGR